MEHSRDHFHFNRFKHLRPEHSSSSIDMNYLGQTSSLQRDIYIPRASFIHGNSMEKRQRDSSGITVREDSNSRNNKLRDSKENAAKDDTVSKKDAAERQSLPKLIRHFLGYTTAHGMNRLGEATGIFWKLFWSLICLGALGMFIYQAHGLFDLYFSKPVSTNVRITFEKQVAFPAVTICNLNMIRNDAVPDILKQEISRTYTKYNATEDSGKIRRRRDVYTTSKPQPLQTTAADVWKPLTTTYRQATSIGPTARYGTSYPTTARYGTSYPTIRYPSTKYYDDYRYYSGYNSGYHDGYYVEYYDKELLPSADQVDQHTLFLERFATFVTHVPVEQLKTSGHQFEDLVTNCSWRGLDCKHGNYSQWWYQTWNYKYGNCYTFNGGKDSKDKRLRVLTTSKPGPNQGLHLQLNIQQNEYLGDITSGAGVRVVLQDQGAMSFPFEEGFSVSPGMSTSVAIQRTVITRVDRFNNKSCWDIDKLDEDNIYRVFDNITKYTKQTCQNSCLGQTQFRECGCSEYTYPSSSPACDAFNETTRKCLAIVHLKFNNDLLPCFEKCRQPCEESIIQKSISMSQWPSTNYEERERSSDANFSANKLLDLRILGLPRGNSAVVLDIFFKELNYHRIEETFTYDVINLLADIGGQLGLWIGVSAITCVEVLELLLLIVVQVVRIFQPNNRSINTMLP